MKPASSGPSDTGRFPFPFKENRENEGTARPTADVVNSSFDSASNARGALNNYQVLAEFGPYRLISELRRHGRSIVYYALHAESERPLVFKTIDTDGLDRLGRSACRMRFQRASRVAKTLQHPAIATLYDCGEERGVYFFAEEFLPYKSLQRLRDETQRLNWEQLLPVLEGVARALDYAHSQNVIHLDLRPSSIFPLDEGGVKITDFSFAEMGSRVESPTASAVRFLSPEQLSDGPPDRRSNIFSLGAILYELLTGTVPFPGEDQKTVTQMILYGRPVPPQEINDAIGPDLGQRILKALEKHPRERYPDCTSFVAELKGAPLARPQRSAVQPAPDIPTVAIRALDSDLTPANPDAGEEEAAKHRANLLDSLFRTEAPSKPAPDLELTPEGSPHSVTDVDLESSPPAASTTGSSQVQSRVPVEAVRDSRATSEPVAEVSQVVPELKGAARATGPEIESASGSGVLFDVAPAVEENPEKAPHPPLPLTPWVVSVPNSLERPSPSSSGFEAGSSQSPGRPALWAIVVCALAVLVILGAVISWRRHREHAPPISTEIVNSTAAQSSPPPDTQPSSTFTGGSDSAAPSDASGQAPQSPQGDSGAAASHTDTTPQTKFQAESLPKSSASRPHSETKAADSPGSPVDQMLAPANEEARLLVGSNLPGARITLDGHSDPGWITPHIFEQIPPGRHDLVISKTGYKDDRRSLSLTKGGTLSVQAMLIPWRTQGEIDILTTPSGAEVLVDGRPYGPSPVQVLVPAGRHTFTVRQPGREPYQGTIEVKEGSIVARRLTWNAR